MDHPLFVGVLQAQGGLAHVLAGQAHRQRAFRRDQAVQVGALDVLQDQERVAAGLAGVEDGDDVGVDEPGRGPRLLLEAANGFGGGEPVAAQHLEGDHTVEAQVAGLEDLAHAAAPQPPQDFEPGDVGPVTTHCHSFLPAGAVVRVSFRDGVRRPWPPGAPGRRPAAARP